MFFAWIISLMLNRNTETPSPHVEPYTGMVELHPFSYIDWSKK